MPKKGKAKRKTKSTQKDDESSNLDINQMFVIDKTPTILEEIPYPEAIVDLNQATKEPIEVEIRKRKQVLENFDSKRKKDEEIEKKLDHILFIQPDEELQKHELTPNLILKNISESDSDSDINEKDDLKPAWDDLDDEKVFTKKAALQQTTNDRLRERFEDAYGNRPSWANKHLRKVSSKVEILTPGSDSEDEVDTLLLKKTKLTQSSSVLRPSYLSIYQLRDANKSFRPDAAMRCVEFHPFSQLLLSAGFHKTLDIYQIDGRNSSRVQGVHIENFPIHTAHFSAGGEEIILNSMKAHFFVYDLKADKIQKIFNVRGHPKEFFSNCVPSPKGDVLAFLGKDGYIVLLSARTKQWIADLKMNGLVRSVAFAKNGNLMLSGGSDGEVYVWDMNTRDCVNKFQDEGCGIIHALSASGGEMPMVAVGSDAGVVNMYDSSCFYSTGASKPFKVYKNLTTSVTNCTFSPTNEIFAFFSYRNKHAIRVAHTNTHTVYSNWPKQESNLGYINALDFSYNSKYMALGNDLGRVMIFRLNYFFDK